VGSVILNITFDCADPRAVAGFWSALTKHPVEAVHQPGNDYWVVTPPAGAGPQQAEVDRLVELGATVVDDRRAAEPGGWVVLADPEGNEFCLEVGPREEEDLEP
jgi:hypothetical protein